MSALTIDVHSHALVPTYVKILKADGAYGVAVPEWSVDQHLDVMDRNGIDVCILSIPEGTTHSNGLEARKQARIFNEELAAIVASHPTRLGAVATVPMDDMDGALEEMVYALDILKLDGVSATTHHDGIYLGQPNYDPWFAEMDRRGATLFIHPVAPPKFDASTSRLNVSILEFMFDTTRMVTNMVLSGAKRRFGQVNMICTHAGGTIPYLAHRVAMGAQMPWAYRDGVQQSEEQIRESLGSFYFDLTASTSAATLDALKRLVAVDHMLLGFDFPFMPPQTIAPARKLLDTYPGFGDEDRSNISGKNGAQLFPRVYSTST